MAVMQNCNFCDSPVNNFDAECSTCGFDSKKEHFNKNIAQSVYQDLIKNDWRKGIRFAHKLNDYLIQRKGFASTNPARGGWSITKTANLLGKSTSGISQQINLAKELQNYQSSDNTVGQILRYMGWVKRKFADGDGKVEGIIISRSEDQYINYALEYTKYIIVKYWRINENRLSILDPWDAHVETINSLSPEEKIRLVSELEKLQK
jgi:hypothetical protein